MIIGDNVLVNTGDGVYRPSDIGRKVNIAGSWTLQWNNGIKLTIWGNPKFQIIGGNYYPFNSLHLGSAFGYKHNMKFMLPENWDSVVDLEDLIGKKGTFDLNNKGFAGFAGWFLASVLEKEKYPNQVLIETKRIKQNHLDYLKSIYPAEAITEEKSFLLIYNGWLIKFMDALFDFKGLISVPDELILDTPLTWLNEFYNGFLDGLMLEKTSGYEIPRSKFNLLQDIALISQRLNKIMNIKYRLDSGKRRIFIKHKVSEKSNLSIVDGWENIQEEILYDIGEGDFDVSGIVIRG